MFSSLILLALSHPFIWPIRSRRSNLSFTKINLQKAAGFPRRVWKINRAQSFLISSTSHFNSLLSALSKLSSQSPRKIVMRLNDNCPVPLTLTRMKCFERLLTTQVFTKFLKNSYTVILQLGKQVCGGQSPLDHLHIRTPVSGCYSLITAHSSTP